MALPDDFVATPIPALSPSSAADGRSAAATPAGADTATAEFALGGDSRTLQLLTRMVVGVMILGIEELAKRADKWEEVAPTVASLAPDVAAAQEATYAELTRYWLLGLVAWGRRSTVRAARGALTAPGALIGSVVRTTDRLTEWPFLRPLRRPIAQVILQSVEMSQAWIAEGRREEQISRWVAAHVTPEILDDVIDVIAKNPQLAALVREQIGAQSVGMASSVIDSTRRLSTVGDDVAETVLRRLLRRGPRAEIARIEPVDEPALLPDGKD